MPTQVLDASGEPILLGSPVRDAHGLEGIVSAIEGNGQYVRVQFDDGIRARSRLKLWVSGHPVPATAPRHGLTWSSATSRTGVNLRFGQLIRYLQPSVGDAPPYEVEAKIQSFRYNAVAKRAYVVVIPPDRPMDYFMGDQVPLEDITAVSY